MMLLNVGDRERILRTIAWGSLSGGSCMDSEKREGLREVE